MLPSSVRPLAADSSTSSAPIGPVFGSSHCEKLVALGNEKPNPFHPTILHLEPAGYTMTCFASEGVSRVSRGRQIDMRSASYVDDSFQAGTHQGNDYCLLSFGSDTRKRSIQNANTGDIRKMNSTRVTLGFRSGSKSVRRLGRLIDDGEGRERGRTRLLLYLLHRYGVRRYFKPVAMIERIALCGPVWCGALLAAVAITIWVPFALGGHIALSGYYVEILQTMTQKKSCLQLHITACSVSAESRKWLSIWRKIGKPSAVGHCASTTSCGGPGKELCLEI